MYVLEYRNNFVRKSCDRTGLEGSVHGGDVTNMNLRTGKYKVAVAFVFGLNGTLSFHGADPVDV